MDKTASPAELQAKLRRLLAYAESEHPSRAKLASDLRELAAALHTAAEALKCEFERNCKKPVTHIDAKGYVYCEDHASRRDVRIRKLRPAEISKLEDGGTVKF